jgi:hypothetical protein
MFRILDRILPARKKPRPKRPPKVWTVRPCIEVLEDRTVPADFVVTNTGDAGTGSGNSGDLRYGITQANNSTDPTNFIYFASNVTGAISLNSQLPAIANTKGSVDIVGPGAGSLAVERNPSQPNFDIFTVNQGANAEIQGLGITGGSVNSSGGGIYNAGTLTLINDQIFANYASGPGATGGGIYNATTGNLLLANCLLSMNVASFRGGAIDNEGFLADTDSMIAGGNSATYGGGYYGGLGSTANLSNTQISYNSAS